MRIFISKSAEECTSLARWCSENRLVLHAESLLSFEEVPFLFPTQVDIVFFTSPRSVEFFLKQVKVEDLSGKLFAAIGKKTAEIVEKAGLNCSFIGEKSGDPEQVNSQFLSWVGERKVFIPQSNISNESIGKSDVRIQRAVAYRTVLQPKELPEYDMYIFTSPSNFKAFNIKNKVPSSSKIIVWGKTSAKELQKQGHTPKFVLNDASMESLERWIQMNF